jgi:hypothetical protein
MYRRNHRLWSFQSTAMPAVGDDDLPTPTRSLCKASL